MEIEDLGGLLLGGLELLRGGLGGPATEGGHVLLGEDVGEGWGGGGLFGGRWDAFALLSWIFEDFFPA